MYDISKARWLLSDTDVILGSSFVDFQKYKSGNNCKMIAEIWWRLDLILIIRHV